MIGKLWYELRVFGTNDDWCSYSWTQSCAYSWGDKWGGSVTYGTF